MNTKLKLGYKVAKSYNHKSSRTEEDKKRMNVNRNLKAGSIFEEHVLSLAQEYMGGIMSAWLAEAHSVLDNELKVDLMLDLALTPEQLKAQKDEWAAKRKKGKFVATPVTSYVVQIKSTREQAVAHLKRRKVYAGGKEYNVPGVVWKTSNWQILLQLRDVTGLPFTSRVEELHKMREKFAGQTVPANWFPLQVEDLTTLGIAKYSRDFVEITFAPRPLRRIFPNPITEEELE